MKAWDGWKTGMGGMIGRLREGGKWVFIVNILIWYFEGRVELRNDSLDIAAYREYKEGKHLMIWNIGVDVALFIYFLSPFPLFYFYS